MRWGEGRRSDNVEDRRGIRVSRGMVGGGVGTIVLVLVFLAAFIVYFFVNWKILSFLWRIG